MTPLQHHDGTLAFDNDIDAVLNIIPVDTMRLLNKIDDKYDDNIVIRFVQELLVHDECLYETLGEYDDARLNFFATIDDFLKLCIEFIRVGDELPIYLVGDYYNMTVHSDHVLNDLRTALNGAMEFVKADKYANIPDVSTDMFVAVLSTTYDFVVG